MRIIIYILFGCISLAYIGSAWTDLDYMLSILTSLYIPVCLIYFLREKVDIFEKETWADLFLVFMISCIITFLFGFILTFRDSVFTTLHTDNPSFADMLFGVAFLEEILKIIPVLIILKLMKSINEPIDYLIYASISALGFAFLENIEYIYHYKEDLIHIVGVRSFMSTLLHLYTTSIIGIGLYEFQFGRKEYRDRYLIGSFITAILLHTIWNLYGHFGIQYNGVDITVYHIILLLSSGYYGNSIKRLLKASPFYLNEKIINEEDWINSSNPYSNGELITKVDSWPSKTKILINNSDWTTEAMQPNDLINVILPGKTERMIKREQINKYSKPTSKNTVFLFVMIFGVFIIDAIFEYIQSQSYNSDFIWRSIFIFFAFTGFFVGPLNTGDISKYYKEKISRKKKSQRKREKSG